MHAATAAAAAAAAADEFMLEPDWQRACGDGGARCALGRAASMVVPRTALAPKSTSEVSANGAASAHCAGAEALRALPVRQPVSRRGRRGRRRPARQPVGANRRASKFLYSKTTARTPKPNCAQALKYARAHIEPPTQLISWSAAACCCRCLLFRC